jgi:hypothetical protein
MKLVAERNGKTLLIGDGYTFESAYNEIVENDSDCGWHVGYDLVLVDGETRWLFEADCWVAWVFENGEWVEQIVND